MAQKNFIESKNLDDDIGELSIFLLTKSFENPVIQVDEKGQIIAMGYVPFDGSLNANGFPKWELGKKYKIHLPDIYADKPGEPVDAVTVDVPFTESFNANTREVVKG